MLPGKHTGCNHSGKLGQVNFMNGVMGLANAERTTDYIRVITEFISQPEHHYLILMFSIVNEALISTIDKVRPTSLCTLSVFYLQAHDMIGGITGIGEGRDPFMVIHHGFQDLSTWYDILPGSDRIAMVTAIDGDGIMNAVDGSNKRVKPGARGDRRQSAGYLLKDWISFFPRKPKGSTPTPSMHPAYLRRTYTVRSTPEQTCPSGPLPGKAQANILHNSTHSAIPNPIALITICYTDEQPPRRIGPRLTSHFSRRTPEAIPTTARARLRLFVLGGHRPDYEVPSKAQHVNQAEVEFKVDLTSDSGAWDDMPS
ncbi:hypothetical protein NM688_g4050 [Phlebia brevispora]|uniref:Uncharacterized protein n=1 Tax=Phlebia brevispora TaxID=194682 RepID=A0ACC1T3R1_9APHY|nr:hypothetical protein NM688_g4050 [Phlebia brevispora]